jgi:hypothetical protein
LVLTGTVDAGSTVQIFRDRNGNGRLDDGELLGSASVSGTAYSFTTGTLPIGTHNLRAVATDAAGNVRVSDASVVTIDTYAHAPTGVRLLSVNDGGLFNGDGVVTTLRPTLRVFVPAQAQVGDTVLLYPNTSWTTSGWLASRVLTAADLVAGFVDLTPTSDLAANTTYVLDPSRAGGSAVFERC